MAAREAAGAEPEAVRSAVARVNQMADKVERLANGGNVSHSVVSFDGGGAGIWVAVTCCLVMAVGLLIVVPIGVGAFLFQQGQITKLQQGENAIRAYIHTGKLPPAPQDTRNE